jgi:hypothetical protein
LPLQLDRCEIDTLRHDGDLNESELTGLSLVDQNANGVTLATVLLTDLDLSRSRLEHLTITDGALRGPPRGRRHTR